MWWERAATTRGRVRLTTEIQTELELETGRSIKNNDHVLLIGDGRENWRSKLTKRRWVGLRGPRWTLHRRGGLCLRSALDEHAFSVAYMLGRGYPRLVIKGLGEPSGPYSVPSMSLTFWICVASLVMRGLRVKQDMWLA
jgi:hypothetical protein